MRSTSFFLATVAASCLLASLPTAAQRLNDTGQVMCYDNSASTGTVSSGTPTPEDFQFRGQDCTGGAAAADALGRMVKVGGSSVMGRDYTKIANDGSELGPGAMLGTSPTDWACTRDNVTGLIWEVKVDDAANLRHGGHTYTWYDTTAINGGNAGTQASNTCSGTLGTNCNTTAYRDAVNALTESNRLCGATDWRLPSSMELSGLLSNAAESGPTIDVEWFPNTFEQRYWSGETTAFGVNRAFIGQFGDGHEWFRHKDTAERVRLVRGGQ